VEGIPRSKTLGPPSSLHKLRPTKWRAFIIKPAELPQLPTVQLIDSCLSCDSTGVRQFVWFGIVVRKISGQLGLMAGVPVAKAVRVVFVTQPQEFIMRTVGWVAKFEDIISLEKNSSNFYQLYF